MRDTTIELSPEQRARLATACADDGSPVPSWEFDVLAPAGALRSTVDDMLTFVEANLTTIDSALSKAMASAREKHFEHWWDGASGLGWIIMTTAEGPVIHWHDGGTGGYLSFMGISEGHDTGVVLLSNYGNTLSGEDPVGELGLRILKLATKVSVE